MARVQIAKPDQVDDPAIQGIFDWVTRHPIEDTLDRRIINLIWFSNLHSSHFSSSYNP